MREDSSGVRIVDMRKRKIHITVEMKRTKRGKTIMVDAGHRATATKDYSLSDPEGFDLAVMHK